MIYQFDEYRLDVSKMALTRGGEAVPMEPQVFDVLAALEEETGQAVTWHLSNVVQTDT